MRLSGKGASAWSRAALTCVAVGALTLGVAACGGHAAKQGARTVGVATFTPVPPGYTPPANPTTAAARAQVAATRTAAAGEPTWTAPAGGSPTPDVAALDGTVVFPTPPSTADNLVYPPLSVLRSSGHTVAGAVGAYVWYEPSAEAVGGTQGPVPEIPYLDEQCVTATSAEATLLFHDDDTAVDPVSTDIQVFPFAGNTARPTDAQGQVGEHPVFIRQTDPALATTVAWPTPAFALAVPPGDYFVLATVTWPAVPGTEQYGDQLSQYLYRVSVQ